MDLLLTLSSVLLLLLVDLDLPNVEISLGARPRGAGRAAPCPPGRRQARPPYDESQLRELLAGRGGENAAPKEQEIRCRYSS